MSFKELFVDVVLVMPKLPNFHLVKVNITFIIIVGYLTIKNRGLYDFLRVIFASIYDFFGEPGADCKLGPIKNNPLKYFK